MRGRARQEKNTSLASESVSFFLVFIFFFPPSSTMPPLGTDADAALRSILDVTLVQAAASPSGPLFLADLAKVK